MFEINRSPIRRLRLWLASLIAPRGADVHDPDETACPSGQDVLTAIYRNELITQGRNVLLDVTSTVDEAYGAGLVVQHNNGTWTLTPAGGGQLARLWGTDRVPPGLNMQLECPDHGRYELSPGQRLGCTGCGVERALRRLAQ